MLERHEVGKGDRECMCVCVCVGAGNSKLNENMRFEERPEGSEEASLWLSTGREYQAEGTASAKVPGEHVWCV